MKRLMIFIDHNLIYIDHSVYSCRSHLIEL